MSASKVSVKCPKCGLECAGEVVSGHIGFNNCECDNCGLEFCYDDFGSHYYTMFGELISRRNK